MNQEKLTVKHSRRRRCLTGVLAKDLTLEQVEQWFHLPSHEACVQLGVSLSVLKRVCRRLGIPRWPYRTSTAAAAARRLPRAGSTPAQPSTPRSPPSPSSSTAGTSRSQTPLAAYDLTPSRHSSPATGGWAPEPGQDSSGSGQQAQRSGPVARAAAYPTPGVDSAGCASGGWRSAPSSSRWEPGPLDPPSPLQLAERPQPQRPRDLEAAQALHGLLSRGGSAPPQVQPGRGQPGVVFAPAPTSAFRPWPALRPQLQQLQQQAPQQPRLQRPLMQPEHQHQQLAFGPPSWEASLDPNQGIPTASVAGFPPQPFSPLCDVDFAFSPSSNTPWSASWEVSWEASSAAAAAAAAAPVGWRAVACTAPALAPALPSAASMDPYDAPCYAGTPLAAGGAGGDAARMVWLPRSSDSWDRVCVEVQPREAQQAQQQQAQQQLGAAGTAAIDVAQQASAVCPQLPPAPPASVQHAQQDQHAALPGGEQQLAQLLEHGASLLREQPGHPLAATLATALLARCRAQVVQQAQALVLAAGQAGAQGDAQPGEEAAAPKNAGRSRSRSNPSGWVQPPAAATEGSLMELDMNAQRAEQGGAQERLRQLAAWRVLQHYAARRGYKIEGVRRVARREEDNSRSPTSAAPMQE